MSKSQNCGDVYKGVMRVLQKYRYFSSSKSLKAAVPSSDVFKALYIKQMYLRSVHYLQVLSFCLKNNLNMDKKLEVEFDLVLVFVLIFIKLLVYPLHDSRCNCCLFFSWCGGWRRYIKCTDGLTILFV